MINKGFAFADMKLKFNGVADWSATFLQDKQLYDENLWKKFVDVYRTKPDGQDQGWRGEFWGKMMRGAALVCDYTRDEKLYSVLTGSVKDMLSVAEEDGRVSAYTRETEFDAWDIWSRKYVMLAMEYYLDICKDESLKQEILTFITGCANYIIERIGNGEGKKRIVKATRSWFGLNSSSVLEPIVRLYKLTGEKRYLDFAGYIVSEGGAEGINIFELAYEDKLLPYQYGVSKAYEMMSCFEGLLEYYDVTGIEKYKTAVINFGNAVMNSEVSIIGTCGATHELFDYTRVRQTIREDEVMQETCVTVTWMKFCSRLLRLTGEAKYADAIEQSFYNAYLGTLNTDDKLCEYAYEKFVLKKKILDTKDTYLVFDSYSPLTKGKRGKKIGGSQLLEDHSYYGCCTCIGAIGTGVFLKHAVLVDDEGIVINFYEKGEAEVLYKGTKISISMDTAYPSEGKIQLKVKTDKPQEFSLKLRVPSWHDNKGGYKVYTKVWEEDVVQVEWNMEVKVHYPETWDEDIVYIDTSQNSQEFHCAAPQKVYHKEEDDYFVAYTRGPLVLASDARIWEEKKVICDTKACSEVSASREIIDGVTCLVKVNFKESTGEMFSLVDYGSAGRDWISDIAAWLPTKHKHSIRKEC